MGLTLVTDASVEPITLTQGKNFLKMESVDTGDDTLISTLIKSARKHCEKYTQLAFINQTWDMTLDNFPEVGKYGVPWWDGVREGSIAAVFGGQAPVPFPKSPLSSVVSITTYGTDDAANTFDLAQIQTDLMSRPGRIFLKYGQIWPVNLRITAAVKIRAICGYGADATYVPDDLIAAMYLMLGHFYENRQPVTEGRVAETPLSVRELLEPYKVKSI